MTAASTAIEAAPEVIQLLKDIVRWHGERDEDTDEILPASRQPSEIARAMRVLEAVEAR